MLATLGTRGPYLLLSISGEQGSAQDGAVEDAQGPNRPKCRPGAGDDTISLSGGNAEVTAELNGHKPDVDASAQPIVHFASELGELDRPVLALLWLR